VIHNHNLDCETCMEKINEAYLSLIWQPLLSTPAPLNPRTSSEV